MTTPDLIRDHFARDAGLLYLCAIAGGAVAPGDVTAQSMTALGWCSGSEIRCTPSDITAGTRHVRYMLDRLDLLRGWIVCPCIPNRRTEPACSPRPQTPSLLYREAVQ